MNYLKHESIELLKSMAVEKEDLQVMILKVIDVCSGPFMVNLSLN